MICSLSTHTISQPTSSPSSSPSKAPSNSPTNTPTGAPSLSPNDGGATCDIEKVDPIGIPVDCKGEAHKPYCCKRDEGAGNLLEGKCTPRGSVSSCKEGPASPNTCEKLPSEAGGSVTPFPCGQTIYEAEGYGGSGVSVQSSNRGYTGSGYMDYDSNAGSYVEFTGVDGYIDNGDGDGPFGGICTIRLRYANGSGDDRFGTISVNGAPPVVNGSPVSDVVQFPTTGGWTKWAYTTAIEDVACNTDPNVIRITAGPGQGPNLDHLEVTVTDDSITGDFIVCCVLGTGSKKYGECRLADDCDPGDIPDTPTSSPTFEECEEPSSKSGKSGAPSNGKSGKSNSNRRLGNEGIVPYGM